LPFPAAPGPSRIMTVQSALGNLLQIFDRIIGQPIPGRADSIPVAARAILSQPGISAGIAPEIAGGGPSGIRGGGAGIYGEGPSGIDGGAELASTAAAARRPRHSLVVRGTQFGRPLAGMPTSINELATPLCRYSVRLPDGDIKGASWR
jgi:hypothetical protein